MNVITRETWGCFAEAGTNGHHPPELREAIRHRATELFRRGSRLEGQHGKPVPGRGGGKGDPF